jgi:hypothetical protein
MTSISYYLKCSKSLGLWLLLTKNHQKPRLRKAMEGRMINREAGAKATILKTTKTTNRKTKMPRRVRNRKKQVRRGIRRLR